MAYSEEIEALINTANKHTAEWFGRVYEVIRPTPHGEVRIDRRKFRAEANAGGTVEPSLPELTYYRLKSDVYGLKNGDVLVDPTGEAPTMTIINMLNVKDNWAMRTDRIGSIYNNIKEDPELPMVRYEWGKRGGIFTPGEQPIIDAISGVASRKLYFYGYDDRLPQNFYYQGKQMLETDGTLDPPRRWIIKTVEYIRPVIVLTLEEDN